MKYIIGTILTTAILVTLLYFVLQIWEVQLFDPNYLSQTWKTIALVALGAVLITVLFAYYFKPNDKGYDRSRGNIAHPKH